MVQFAVIPLPTWAAQPPRRRRGPSRWAQRCAELLYCRVALRQLADATGDYLAGTGRRDDVELCLAAARTALAESSEEGGSIREPAA